VTEGLNPEKDSFRAELISKVMLSVHSALMAEAMKARVVVARANFIVKVDDIETRLVEDDEKTLDLF
jgi:hypothetical protein